jgi:hypothetical protein
MLGDNPDDWTSATFLRPSGSERRRILLVDGRPPLEVLLPVNEEEREQFQLDEWQDGEPVYRSLGLIPWD